MPQWQENQNVALKENISVRWTTNKMLKMSRATWRTRGEEWSILEVTSLFWLRPMTNVSNFTVRRDLIFFIKINLINPLISGSPADKADLEVADEILEINGKALQSCSHTEVIAHIHNVSFSILEMVTTFQLLKTKHWLRYETVWVSRLSNILYSNLSY